MGQKQNDQVSFVFEITFDDKITHSKSFMINSPHSANVQAFTTLWDIKFEQMVAIVKFVQRRRKTIRFPYQIHFYVVTRKWPRTDQYNQLVFQKTVKVLGSKEFT